MEIQLIIRAPNQNIDDQTVNCNMNWTILKLKNHLAEVYPNQPVIQEQKLIYSGRLLHDHLQLKDIIRHDDTQSSVHILHLVCNESTTPVLQEQHHISSQDSSDLSAPDLIPGTSAGPSSENDLRDIPHSFVPQSNNFQISDQQIPVSIFPVSPNDPQLLAQMVAMQQIYAQYILQYWQSITIAASSGNPPVFPVTANFQQNNPNSTVNEIPAQQQINQRINAPAAQPVEENDFADRDWLDNVFQYIRFLILLSIVYFYSTPERLMIVIVWAVIAFLYHEGWFVRRAAAPVDTPIEQRNIVNEANPNAVNEEALPNQNLTANEEVHDGHELEAAMDGDDPPHAQNPDIVNNNHVFSPLTFLTTFFLSLIPEPPPPVNIN